MPTLTPTPSPDIEATIRAINTQDAIIRVVDAAMTSALTPVERNANWTPVLQDFDGVTMVLVPTGSFTMGYGSTRYEFDTPFWIDQVEVTQAQFRRFDGDKADADAFAGDLRPVERITWAEADAYCKRRDARLPTQQEWEYAARGPDNLL